MNGHGELYYFQRNFSPYNDKYGENSTTLKCYYTTRVPFSAYSEYLGIQTKEILKSLVLTWPSLGKNEGPLGKDRSPGQESEARTSIQKICFSDIFPAVAGQLS